MYYDIRNDIQSYPDAWCYIIIGGRGRGKTYSTLKSCLEDQTDFIFIKRAMEDVDLMCAGTGSIKKSVDDLGVDLSPFKAINRDTGSNIQAFSIKTGIAGFWQTVTGEDGKLIPQGKPIGMIFALNGVTKYKGFELASSAQDQWIIFDEFIPNLYDRVNRREGIQLLDFYKTVARDRVQRGLNEIKLICLANATSIANPVFDTLEIMDQVADLQTAGTRSAYDPERGIFIHLLENDSDFMAAEEKTGLYKAMGQTAWGRMSYGNTFAYNDFSNVSNKALKGFRCLCGYHYKDSDTYIYYDQGIYYVTNSRGQTDQFYDLNRENDQKAFFYDYVVDIRQACIYNGVRFKKYSYYDLLVNYKKIFSIN